MNSFLSRIFLGIFLMASVGSASAAVYRCKINGSLVYASHPCGKNAVKLNEQPQTYAPPPVAAMPKHIKASKPARPRKPVKSTCPVESLSSTELRNLRVGHTIMVCESADEVREAWGKPDVVKHKLSHGHVRERWTYNGPRGKPERVVDLEDGKVTSFEDRMAKHS